MIYFFHGNNQNELKDHLFDLKKRAPVVEEFDAAAAAWEDFLARVKTATFLFSGKKEAARLIAVSSLTKSAAQFQTLFFEHAGELARLPDVIVFFEEDEIKDKNFFALMPSCIKIKKFDVQKKASSQDYITTFLFGCANAWVRGDRRIALQNAHTFFEQGGSPEQLLFILAAYAKKRKEPYGFLRVLRDHFIAARLQKADLRSRVFVFLAKI